MGKNLLQAPAFQLAERARFSDADLVANLCFFLLVMSMEAAGATNDFLELWMRNAALDFDNDCLVHLVGDDHAHAGLPKGSALAVSLGGGCGLVAHGSKRGIVGLKGFAQAVFWDRSEISVRMRAISRRRTVRRAGFSS